MLGLMWRSVCSSTQRNSLQYVETDKQIQYVLDANKPYGTVVSSHSSLHHTKIF